MQGIDCFPDELRAAIVYRHGHDNSDNKKTELGDGCHSDFSDDDNDDEFYDADDDDACMTTAPVIAWIAIFRNQTLLMDVARDNEADEGADDEDDMLETAQAVVELEPAVGWDSRTVGTWKGLRFHVYEDTHLVVDYDDDEHGEVPLTVWSFCAVFNTSMISTEQAQKFVQDFVILPTQSMRRTDPTWIQGGYHACQGSSFTEMLQDNLIEFAQQVAASSVFDQDVDLSLCQTILTNNRRLVMGQIHSLERLLETFDEMEHEDDNDDDDDLNSDDDNESLEGDEEDEEEVISDNDDMAEKDVKCEPLFHSDDDAALQAFMAVASRRASKVKNSSKGYHKYPSSVEATETSESTSSSDDEEGYLQNQTVVFTPERPIKQQTGLSSPDDVKDI